MRYATSNSNPAQKLRYRAGCANRAVRSPRLARERSRGGWQGTAGTNPQSPDPEKKNGVTVESICDEQTSYPRLRLEAHQRFVGLPLQTRWLRALVDTKNLVQLASNVV